MNTYLTMNRKKKINQILKKKAKRAKAKLNPKKKPRYIPKAERAEQESKTLLEEENKT